MNVSQVVFSQAYLISQRHLSDMRTALHSNKIQINHLAYKNHLLKEEIKHQSRVMAKMIEGLSDKVKKDLGIKK
jgi:hypothetical protein